MQDSKIVGLAEGLDGPVLKLFKRGTHRIISPDDTLARIVPKAPQIGITRLGNVTGLDRIGIPVTVAVRPNSRSVSVSQGKGLGISQALASALMEAIELFHAEEPAGRAVEASFLELSANARVVRPGLLSGGEISLLDRAKIGWMEGYDPLARETCWVPWDVVHTDYTLQLVMVSSNTTSSPAPMDWLLAIISSKPSARPFVSSSSATQSPCGMLETFASVRAAISMRGRSTTEIAVRSWNCTRLRKYNRGFGM